MKSTDYDELIGELRAEYLESFHGKYEQMLQSFKQGQWRSLEMEFHKLKGTGRTYGAPEVTQLSERMEQICKTCKEDSPLEEALLMGAISLYKKIQAKYLANRPFDMDQEPEYLAIVNRKN